MRKTKIRLRKWVKVVLSILLIIIVFLIISLILKKGSNDFDELAEKCDQERGYTCTYYDVRQYSLGK